MKILYVLVLIVFTELAAAKPIPFRAVYQANYENLPIKVVGVRELREIETNKFLFSSSANAFFTTINESSVFSWNDRIIPIKYKYIREGLGKDKNDLITFNWETNTANYDNENHIIVPGTIDRLAYQLQLRYDLANIKTAPWPIMDYMVIEANNVKRYNFSVLGMHDIETSIGKFETLKLDRIRGNSDRKTTFWLALEYDFLLIKLKQSEPGNTFQLLLKEAEINGQTLRGK